MEEIKQIIATCIYDTLDNENITLEDIKLKIEVPKDKQNGDFAYPCFNLAKSLRKSPVNIAEDIKSKIKLDDKIEKVEVVNGFLNFYLNDLDVVNKVRYEQIFMFIYSRRVGTVADKMENQIEEKIKHERFNRLKKLAEEIIEEGNKKYIRKVEKVLVEGKSKTNDKLLTGRTETNKVVNFEGNDELIGKVIPLKIVSEHMWYLKGKYDNI